MQMFNESMLIAELERLPAPLRVAFAAACAERQMAAYWLFEAQNGRKVPNALARALEDVSIDPGLVHDREEFEQRVGELMLLISQEEALSSRGPRRRKDPCA